MSSDSIVFSFIWNASMAAGRFDCNHDVAAAARATAADQRPVI